MALGVGPPWGKVGVKITAIIRIDTGTSLVVQWLGLCASTTGGTGLIPGWGTRILHATWRGQKKKKKIETRNVDQEFSRRETSVRNDLEKL